MELAYTKIDAEDDIWVGNLNEALGTHPMIISRIKQIRQFATTNQYKRLV